MSLGQKTRAAQRLVFSSSLSHSNAKFAVPPCALGFGTKDDSLAKSPPSFRLEETLPPTRRYCMWITVLAFVRYGHTAISSRIDGIAAPGYTAACSLARILHFACDPQVAILQAHCMTPPGDSRTPAQPLPRDLTRYAQWSRTDSRAAVLPISRTETLHPSATRICLVCKLLVQ